MDANAIVIQIYSCIDMSLNGSSNENFATAKSYIIKIEINEIIVGQTFGFSNPKRNTIESIKKTKKKRENGEENQTEL